MADDVNYWQGVFWRRMSRRGFIRAAAVSGVALGVGGALGCQTSAQPSAPKTTGTTPSSSPAAATTPTPKGPKRGGVHMTSINQDAAHLDMHTAIAHTTNQPMGFVYNPLIRLNREWDLAKGILGAAKYDPEIAESWEQPDSTTYVFKIRKGVKFQNLPPVNGREVTSEDVKWSVERIMTPQPEYIRAAMFAGVEKLEAPDNYTFKIKLKEPYAPFLDAVGDGWNVIAAKEVVAKDGDLKTTTAGTGAFILEKWNRGVSYEFKRNPDYFLKDRIHVDGVKLMQIKDKGMTLASFRSRDLDRAGGLTKADLDQLKQGNTDLVVWTTYGGHPWIFMNNTRPPFDDKNVRKACAHATNVQDYIDMLWDGKGKRNGPMEFYQAPWALPESDLPKFDLKLAKEYMAKSKYPNGFKVVSDVVAVSYSKECMEIAQQQWKAIGIELELNLMELNPWMAKVVTQKDYAVSQVLDWSYSDPNDWLYTYFHSKGSNNRCKYSNPEFDKLAEEQRRELNREKRIPMVLKLQRMLIEDAAMIDLASYESYQAFHPYLKGFRPFVLQPQGGGGDFYMRDVWLDK